MIHTLGFGIDTYTYINIQEISRVAQGQKVIKAGCDSLLALMGLTLNAHAL